MFGHYILCVSFLVQFNKNFISILQCTKCLNVIQYIFDVFMCASEKFGSGRLCFVMNSIDKNRVSGKKRGKNTHENQMKINFKCVLKKGKMNCVRMMMVLIYCTAVGTLNVILTGTLLISTNKKRFEKKNVRNWFFLNRFDVILSLSYHSLWKSFFLLEIDKEANNQTTKDFFYNYFVAGWKSL